MNEEETNGQSGGPVQGLSEQEADFLISQYEEHCEHGRHCETERSALTTLVLATQAAVFTYLGAKEFSCKFKIVEWLIPALSLYGFVATLQLYRRIERHHKFIGGFRHALEKRLPGAGVQDICRELRGTPKGYGPWYWPALHATIGIGAAIAILVFKCANDGSLDPEGTGGARTGVLSAPIAVTIENSPTISVGSAPTRTVTVRRPCPCSCEDPVSQHKCSQPAGHDPGATEKH
jgi:hypothetical protein